jgi:hypothetical protein
MLTIKQMFNKTSQDRKQRANYVKVVSMKTGRTPKGLGFVAAKTYSRVKVDNKGKLVTNTNPTHYVSMIIFVDKKLHCNVSCSCDDNLFRWEYSNTQNDASEIEYSNGEPAVVTNPENQPGLCKHLCALYEKIKSKLP